MLDHRQAGPTALRMQIGARLRRLRERNGISRATAGAAIRGSASKMSRLENGRHGFKLRDVTDLLDLYGVRDRGERDSLLELVDQAKEPGWWHAYGDVVPTWFEQYLGLEQSAAAVRSYEAQYVPGLLQTREYARAVIALEHDKALHEVLDRRLTVRMMRQKILYRPTNPVSLWAIIDEAALRRPFGGPATMRGQIEHLIEVARHMPHVNVQVLPFAASGDLPLGGPVTVLRFAENDLDDIVYLEQLTGARYPEVQEVARCKEVMDLLAIRAARPDRTITILEELLKDY
ncbi:helix-turn-helix domain-containing protein [Spirillospora albida]|uniref:helix-turn-helix domain-containing protein n=1 Tax=Spirillospora albida TaxID=58123 RepID=UPI0004C073FC|nr:helix-turn-helix transcriptional regulator [Spirillospora albida]